MIQWDAKKEDDSCILMARMRSLTAGFTREASQQSLQALRHSRPASQSRNQTLLGSNGFAGRRKQGVFTFLTVSAACFMRILPTAVEPVNPILRTSSLFITVSAARRRRSQCQHPDHALKESSRRCSRVGPDGSQAQPAARRCCETSCRRPGRTVLRTPDTQSGQATPGQVKRRDSRVIKCQRRTDDFGVASEHIEHAAGHPCAAGQLRQRKRCQRRRLRRLQDHLRRVYDSGFRAARLFVQGRS